MSRFLCQLLAVCAVLAGYGNLAHAAVAATKIATVLKSEFIYEKASFPSCHASTIAETKDGLVAAWFGGTGEGKTDVGIWFARHNGQQWSAPVEVATGKEPDGKRYPCWNPVLFQSKNGPLLLFYKVGPSPSRWWGMLLLSSNAGASWSSPRKLPEGILGPIKNKPIELEDSTLLCGSSTEHAGWRVHIESTKDLGQRWEKTGPLNDGKEFGAIQPAILRHPDYKLQILCRSRQKCITQSWSADGGKTWSKMESAPLANPNSGIDAVTLQDGRHALVYNATTSGRSPLNLALSGDGKIWTEVALLENEPGEYSYPAIIQTSDGRLHITYTWKRQRIRHLEVDATIK